MGNSSSARTLARSYIPYLLLAVLALGSGVTAWASSRPSRSSVGPEGVTIDKVANLAPASTTRSGLSVDGIACATLAKEVVKYHTHTHLVLYVRGRLERLPAGIGITRPALVEKYATGTFYDVGVYDCLYWLHTHVADGIIHAEAPMKESFTLGQFFDIWHQPLGPSRVGPARGPVVVFENGKRISGNPRSTPLLDQGEIQIDIGAPVVPYHAFSFHVTGACGQGTNSCSGSKS